MWLFAVVEIDGDFSKWLTKHAHKRMCPWHMRWRLASQVTSETQRSKEPDIWLNVWLLSLSKAILGYLDPTWGPIGLKLINKSRRERPTGCPRCPVQLFEWKLSEVSTFQSAYDTANLDKSKILIPIDIHYPTSVALCHVLKSKWHSWISWKSWNIL